MKKYKIELTTTELEKLNIFLVMYENKLKDNAEMYRREYKENSHEYCEEALKTFKSNAEWYQDTYAVINKIRKTLDVIPF